MFFQGGGEAEKEGQGLRVCGDGCAVVGGTELGTDGPAVSLKAWSSPLGLGVPWKVLKQKNDMSRCIKQHLSLQTAEMGSGQLKTQIGFLERCEEAPRWKEGQSSQAPEGQGEAAASLGRAEKCQHQSASSLLSPHSRFQFLGDREVAYPHSELLPTQQPKERAT